MTLTFKLEDNHKLQESEKAIITSSSYEEKTRLLVLRDLLRLNWALETSSSAVVLTPPPTYDRDVVRLSMSHRRAETIEKNSNFISRIEPLARSYLASGTQVLNAEIRPSIEICTSQLQNDLFRYFRYHWSSPSSEYVGRRIRVLIRDESIQKRPIIGIAALGSSIIHIPERDLWIGWSKEQRTQNIIYTMDAYVLGALPPYNLLLGGKLVSYIVASNEMRSLYQAKYRNAVTLSQKRKASRLACLFTTSLFGKSAQYNQISYNNRRLYKPIGYTKGYGTLHLSNETFSAMRDLLEARGIEVSNKFGDGPSWAMRLIRTVGDILDFDSDFLLQHSFKREIYAVPFASNYKEFLKGERKRLTYLDNPMQDMVNFWKVRWLPKRKTRNDVIAAVKAFEPRSFSIA